MKFGLHHSSWLESPDPAEAYEAVKAKAQWARVESGAFCGFLGSRALSWKCARTPGYP